ncbi:variable surface lipoprotein [Mycoplasmopsis bovis]|uniref:variable surface lipoprotein n=1 Tax=Mycoplasmopsis bovis TaxID=28903 RepID=UPI001CF561E3|nr:variable surface lipoprotein [Mycoplasmopsis bovis]MCA8841329.1 variable surface lipoprotein [Mycoplasmopsis bovis]MCA8842115.1 variable surface lipoprotein [Mycoplasmopsis bovis]MCA8844482.1 variable surface lipoprotein [Mycoplasmopsis bovis]MCA8845291.1 variable surface lipoprotein [Mycoplasmopsis bovis]MCA8846844.1 variable surface lipoprotein [Mycoplasmopsis bovis]
MKKSKFLLLTTLSPIISLPFLSASCITEAKPDNKTEKDIKINENTDEKNSSETMNDKQKQDKGSTESKMKEKTGKQDSKTNSEKQNSGTKSEKEEKNHEKPQNDGTTADADNTKIDNEVLKKFKEEVKKFVTEYKDKSLGLKNKALDSSENEFVEKLFMEIDKSKTKEDFEDTKENLTQYAEGGLLSDNEYIAKTKEGDHILFGEQKFIYSWKTIAESEPQIFDSTTETLIKQSEEKRKKVTEKLDKIFEPILNIWRIRKPPIIKNN